MKKVLLSAVVVFVTAMSVNAQMLTPTVIASAGAFSSNANGSLSYTVGEMTMVQTFSANNNILTQGFQQPNDITTGLIDLTQDEFGSFVVYPNPAIDNANFGFQLPEAGKVSITLFNTLGQKVSDVFYTNYENGKIVQPFSVSNFASGSYFLTLTFTSAKDGKSHISTKMFEVVR